MKTPSGSRAQGLAPDDHPSLIYTGLGRPTLADLGASVVVFLVALPLCLGIALASGAPLASGVVAGIIGGFVVGALSGSHVQVSGPAAGLTAIIIAAIASQGSFEAVLPAVVIGGLMQIGLGVARAGVVARYVPNSVIKGMLSAIGIILILKQLPHLVGWDADAMGDDAFFQADQQNTFSELLVAATHIQTGAAVVGAVCLALIVLWPRIPVRAIKAVPAPLAAVLVGTLLSEGIGVLLPAHAIDPSHRVALPQGGLAGFLADLPRPDWSVLTSGPTWTLALTLALVASLETLLSLEAAVKLDPWRREANPDRELVAQGVGNLVAGFAGGLPVTGVIVRSSANADSGAKTRFSAIFHAVWLTIALLVFPGLLARIPLAALAAILFHVGYRLARPALFRAAWTAGRAQFLPYVITIVAILFTNLLVGIGIGLAVGVVITLRESARIPALREDRNTETGWVRFVLAEQVTFIHKAGVAEKLASLPAEVHVEIDGSACRSIDLDVLEVIHEFKKSTEVREIKCHLIDVPALPGGAAAGGH